MYSICFVSRGSINSCSIYDNNHQSLVALCPYIISYLFYNVQHISFHLLSDTVEMHTELVFLFSCIGLLAVVEAADVHLYVSPTGSDLNDG